MKYGPVGLLLKGLGQKAGALNQALAISLLTVAGDTIFHINILANRQVLRFDL
jgi:hypothetical protein